MRAEWLKFRTLPSNPVTVAAVVVLLVGLAAMLLTATAGRGTSPAPTELLTGVSWAQLVLAVLAVVAICSEWTSGTISCTFLATPSRWPVLLGKVTVIGLVAAASGTAGGAGALAVGAAGGTDLSADPGTTARLVLGTGLYLGTVAVLALAIGAVVRHLAGSVVAVLGLLGAAPFAASLVPVPRVQELALYLPTSAGSALFSPAVPDAHLTPAGGYAVLLAWTVAALTCAVVTLHVRDA